MRNNLLLRSFTDVKSRRACRRPKGVLSAIMLCGTLFSLQAQQAAQSTLSMFNPFQWNPASAGLQGNTAANLGARVQWAGLEGRPAMQTANVQAPFEILGGGLGLKLSNDVLGAAIGQHAMLAYSYHLPIGEGLLGLGIGSGVTQRVLDGASLRTPEGLYQGNLTDHRDNLLSAGRMQGMAPVFEAGVYFRNRRLEAGLGATNLNRPALDMGNFTSAEIPAFYFNTALNFDLSTVLNLSPSLWVRSDGLQTQTDFSLMLQYKDNISAGASLRGYSAESLDAVAFIAGFRLSEKIKFAYAYDLSLSPLRQVNNGSHELLLMYALPKIFGRIKLPPIIYNPRNL
ncbi:MAG: PorP/SprF family type IX secretion system membrane protein [Saprospiraceae bacterium]